MSEARFESDGELADDIAAAFDSLEGVDGDDEEEEFDDTEEITDQNDDEEVGDDDEENAELDDDEDDLDEEDENSSEDDGAQEDEDDGDASSDTEDEEGKEDTARAEDEDVGPPPAGWRALAREEWANVPKAARDEINKREQEVRTALQQSTDARNFAQQFVDTARPFQAAIQAEAGGDAMAAFKGLLETASVLRGGTAQDKAMMTARIIGQYGVDLETLADVLDSGGHQVSQQMQQQIDAAVRPYQQQLQQYEQQNQQSQQSQAQQVQKELQDFADDPANEFFQDVRSDMADLMASAAQRGEDLTLQQAYEKACQLNSQVKSVMDARAAAEAAKEKRNEARRKRRAAKSIKGKGAGGGAKRKANKPANDKEELRASIEAAWDSSDD